MEGGREGGREKGGEKEKDEETKMRNTHLSSSMVQRDDGRGHLQRRLGRDPYTLGWSSSQCSTTWIAATC